MSPSQRRTAPPADAVGREVAAVAELRLVAQERRQLLDHVGVLPHDDGADNRSSLR